MKKVLLIIFISMTYQVCNAQKIYEPNWESIDSRPLPAWFEDAKFGIFVHWGLYSVPSWGPTDKDFKYAAGNDWHKRIAMKYSEWYWHRILLKTLKQKIFNQIYGQKYLNPLGQNMWY
jgi:alpha-L-fucosidase